MAEAFKLTAQPLLQAGIIDEIVKEPQGCAHRDHDKAAELLGLAIARNLKELEKENLETLLNKRYDKFRAMGTFDGK
jgi:acetyl-CoA carboxylase carboxyl transferase subunit alpha